MAYNGTVEDYIKEEYKEGYKYLNPGNISNLKSLFKRRDSLDPEYVYNELFLNYSKDAISYNNVKDEYGNITVMYNLPLNKYSNSKVFSRIDGDTNTANANIIKYRDFNPNVNFDNNITNEELVSLSNGYFNNVNKFIETYYDFKQRYMLMYSNNKVNERNDKIDNWTICLDDLQKKLKQSLNECIKLSIELNKRSLFNEIKNNPIINYFGNENLSTIMRYYSNKNEKIEYFSNEKNFNRGAEYLISNDIFNKTVGNNNDVKLQQTALLKSKATLINKDSYEEDLKYKKDVNKIICEKLNSTKKKDSNPEVVNVKKPKDVDKMKGKIIRKVGTIILGAAALAGLASAVVNNVNNTRIEKSNSERVEEAVQTIRTEEAEKEQIKEKIFSSEFEIKESAKMYQSGDLHNPVSSTSQPSKQVAAAIGLVKLDDAGNIIDLQFARDYNSFNQKMFEGYKLYSVLDSNGIAWWDVNDTTLAVLNGNDLNQDMSQDDLLSYMDNGYKLR